MNVRGQYQRCDCGQRVYLTRLGDRLLGRCACGVEIVRPYRERKPALGKLWLLVALAALTCVGAPAAGATKPTLEVWTAKANPQGVSGCPPCNLFWTDYGKNREFNESLNAAFRVVPIYAEDHAVQGRLRMIFELPTFLGPNRLKVEGYTSPDDLLVRLGLRPLGSRPQPEVPAQPQQPPRPGGLTQSQLEQLIKPFGDRLNGLDDAISKNAENIKLFGEWFREDKQQHDQHQAAIVAIADQLAKIEGRTQQSPATQTPPAEPAPKAIKPDEPAKQTGLVEKALELGRYPATWFLGPAGGAGLTGLLWLYRSRKKKAGFRWAKARRSRLLMFLCKLRPITSMSGCRCPTRRKKPSAGPSGAIRCRTAMPRLFLTIATV